MSTKKWVWAIVVIIIILLALWYCGVFSSLMPAPAVTQPAAVTTAVTTASNMAVQDSVIKTDVATLDMQIAAIGSGIAASATPTKQQIATIAASVSTAAVTFNKL